MLLASSYKNDFSFFHNDSDNIFRNTINRRLKNKMHLIVLEIQEKDPHTNPKVNLRDDSGDRLTKERILYVTIFKVFSSFLYVVLDLEDR